MKRDYTIVVLGHKGHGKSSLVRSITGQKSASLINHVALKEGYDAAFIDIPGSRRFLKNSLKWTLQADYVILTVAADDGVMPQTLEIIKLVKYSGVKKGLVVLTKTDSVDEEICELASLEIEEAASDTVFGEKDIAWFRWDQKDSLDSLLKRILDDLETDDKECENSGFRFFVDNTMIFQGFGTVVTGKVISGKVSKDETIYLYPGNIKARVRSVEVHKSKGNEAESGNRAGICLSGIQHSDVKSGMALLKEPYTEKRFFINAETWAAETVKTGQRVKFHHGTSVYNAFIVTLRKEYLIKGDKEPVQFRISEKVAVKPGDRFVISSMNSQIVLGGGTILEVSFEKYRKKKSGKLVPYLEALMDRDIEKSVLLFIGRNFNRASSLKEIAEYSIFNWKEVEKEVNKLLKSGKLMKAGSEESFYLTDNYASILEMIIRVSREYFLKNPLQERINQNEISARLGSDFDSSLLKGMLDELCEKGFMRRSKSGFILMDKPDTLTKNLEKLQNLIVSHAKNKGFLTFSLGSFLRENASCNRNDVQKLLDRLEKQSVLIKLNNDNFLLREVIGDIKKKVEKAIEEKGKINLTHSMEIVGYGRAKAAPVFEYLDDIGFTRREGNERYLNR